VGRASACLQDPTVFLFRAVMDDELVRKGGIELGAFDNLGPGRVWEEPGLEGEHGHAQGGEIGNEGIVFRACLVLTE